MLVNMLIRCRDSSMDMVEQLTPLLVGIMASDAYKGLTKLYESQSGDSSG